MMTLIWRNITEFVLPESMLVKRQWYRARIGGSWHYNRYIFDLGRGAIFCIEIKRIN